MNQERPQKFVITIDGPAASGKGTLARNLGDKLDFPVLDTGLLYRAVGFLVLESDSDPSNPSAAEAAVKELDTLLSKNTDILSNSALREERVSDAASRVSSMPIVRSALLETQRQFAENPPNDKNGTILDGRDIGTVVCPDADVKFFITATPEVRAERRAKDIFGDDWKAHLDAMLQKTMERDRRDTDREVAPLKPAEDAIVLDTTTLGIEAVFDKALALINQKLFEK